MKCLERENVHIETIMWTNWKDLNLYDELSFLKHTKIVAKLRTTQTATKPTKRAADTLTESLMKVNLSSLSVSTVCWWTSYLFGLFSSRFFHMFDALLSCALFYSLSAVHVVTFHSYESDSALLELFEKKPFQNSGGKMRPSDY